MNGLGLPAQEAPKAEWTGRIADPRFGKVKANTQSQRIHYQYYTLPDQERLADDSWNSEFASSEIVPLRAISTADLAWSVLPSIFTGNSESAPLYIVSRFSTQYDSKPQVSGSSLIVPFFACLAC